MSRTGVVAMVLLALSATLVPVAIVMLASPQELIAAETAGDCHVNSPHEEGCCTCEWSGGPPSQVNCYQGAFFGQHDCSTSQGFCPIEIDCMAW